jgi:hypothetical protein
MGSVCSSAEARRPVDLNVFDDQSVDIKTLVVSVGLCVLEQLQQELGRLLRPPALGGAPLLGLRATADAAVEAPERHAFLLHGHVLQEFERTPQGHLLDGLSRFSRVLNKCENSVNTRVRQLFKHMAAGAAVKLQHHNNNNSIEGLHIIISVRNSSRVAEIDQQ